MKQLSNAYVGDELSHGTMRQEDLIPYFMEFLQDVKISCEIVEEVDRIQEEVDNLEIEEKKGYGEYYKNPEDANWILNEDIWDILNNIAPEFTYFGAHEGDGASYGFWTDDESLIEHIKNQLAMVVEENFPDLEETKNTLDDLVELLNDHDI